MQLEIGECFESINDALQSVVNGLGGYKKIGPMLRPELPIDQAAGWLRDCLNPSRREKLAPEQVMLILREARKADYHAAINFIAFDTGYRFTPIDPKTQLDELQERFCTSVEALTSMAAQMERIQRVRGVA
jgi:hypothetical protein